MSGESPFDDLAVDKDVKEELEDTESEELIVEYGASGEGQATYKTRFVENWFPTGDQWQGKTHIAKHQARALALVRNLDIFFTELDEASEFLSAVVEDYEIYQTSVEGRARDDQVAVMRAMFGEGYDKEQSQRLRDMMLAGSMEEEEND